MTLTPRPDQIDTLLALQPVGPVRMLNLLRFRPEGGEALYDEYAEAALPLIAAVGGQPIFSGTAHHLLIGPEGEHWDRVLIVEYPSLATFLQFSQSEEYQVVAGLRAGGLLDSRLVVVE